MLFTAFSTNFTRVFAAGRVLLALTCLLFATTDPDGAGFQFELDDFAVIAWLVAALIAAGLVWSNWWLDHRLFPYLLLLDFGAFVWIPLGIEPVILAYFVVAPMIAGHVIVLAAIYRDQRAAVWVAVALNLICIGICIQHSLSPMGMPLSESARRIFLMAFISVVMLWICRNRMFSPIGFISNAEFTDRAAAVDTALAFAMSECRANGGIAFWRCDMTGECSLRSTGNAEAVVSRVEAEMRANHFGATSVTVLFDMIRTRGLALNDNGLISAVPPRTQAASDLRRDGLRSGISTPLFGANGKGWLILTDIEAMNRFDLYRVKAIAGEVSRYLDQREALETGQLLATSRLREDIARDLHDGVAQSLAGTKFWLQSLRRDLSNRRNVLADFDKFTEALDAEQTHVRELIRNMRGDTSPESQDLGAAIKELASRQALHWRVEIDVAGPAESAVVPRRLALEIEQILRECIANAVRHGSTDSISIAFELDRGRLGFTICDNGSGFEGKEPVATPRTIGERVSSLGGTVQICSEPGKTKIEFSIPLESVH